MEWTLQNTGNKNANEIGQSDYVSVRGILWEKNNLEYWEAFYEAEIIHDQHEYNRFILALDEACLVHRSNSGKFPDLITMHVVDPTLRFIPHVMKIEAPIVGAVPVLHKPAWFVRRKIYLGI